MILTDNGIQFTNQERQKYAFHHTFDRVCDALDIAHRLTKVNHLWTNGQVEPMNRTLRETTATLKEIRPFTLASFSSSILPKKSPSQTVLFTLYATPEKCSDI